MPSDQVLAVRADRNFGAKLQLLFLTSPHRDYQRECNTRQHCLHQHAENVGVEFQIDQEHGNLVLQH